MVGSEETCDLRETHGGERGGMRRNAERCREDQPSRAAVLAPLADEIGLHALASARIHGDGTTVLSHEQGGSGKPLNAYARRSPVRRPR